MTKDNPSADAPKKPPVSQNRREFGEGNYKATRDYKRDIDKFQKTHSPDDIEKAARDAEQAVDGSEAEELKRAEKTGRDRARH